MHLSGNRMHRRHVPSENTLDGQHAAMEAHLVHQIAEPEYVGSNAHLAVVAVLYELGARCNEQLDTLTLTLTITLTLTLTLT